MKLTNREYEVLSLVVKGHSDKEIGRTLNISTRTVQTHVRRIYTKFGVNNRVGATAKFLEKRDLHTA